MSIIASRALGALFTAAGTVLFGASALAGPLAMIDPDSRYPSSVFEQVMPQQDAAEDSTAAPQPRFRRQVVDYSTTEAPGTIVIDTPHTYLYLVQGGGRAIRYGIGVGRDGFTWAGVQTIARKAEWPDWIPPAEMIQRQPYLPRFMAGGPGNPLGARAMYLGNTVYRIHGTNAPSTIGGRVSSGCIRLTNEDVSDLFSRVNVGTKVVVLPMNGHSTPVAQASRTRSTSLTAPALPATRASLLGAQTASN
jgi:lipoprotein-anchoring transpeptidase ErfK/SrfK